MKPNSAKMWPDQGRIIYREPDGTTITLTRLDPERWHARVKWKGHSVEMAPISCSEAALDWARSARNQMTAEPPV